MAGNHDPQTPQPGKALSAQLSRLAFLVGEWDMTSPQFPGSHGRASFAWIEGGAFLLEHSEVKDSPVPVGSIVIGPDDTSGIFTMLYSDSRGVSRVYQMSLEGPEWKIWRDAPGFLQRFIGTLNEAGNKIDARWEKSVDGVHWELDFNLEYTRVE